MAHLDRYLKLAATNRASDVHFSAGEPVRMRVDGDLLPIDKQNFEAEPLRQLLFEILTDHEREKCINSKNLDKSYSVPGIGFFRVNIFWTRRGIGAVLRTIPQKIPTLESLKLPPAATVLAQSPKGLVLVTGPTGSGKSTTLAAMINYINTNCPYHILTAEDPVEFVHESKMSLINQREIGSSCSTFTDALKYALREDPDVILVGELRDLETISLALTAAETGHLVFGTLHTRGAAASVDRVIDSFPANQQAMVRTMMSESLVGVISQSLLKRADGTGRAAAFEIMIVNHAISNLIREGKTFQMTSIIQTGRASGMMLMDQHIHELVTKGIVKAEEAEGYMEDPSTIKHLKGKVAPDAHLKPGPQISMAPNSISPTAPPPLASSPQRPEAAHQTVPRPVAPGPQPMARSAAPIAPLSAADDELIENITEEPLSSDLTEPTIAMPHAQSLARSRAPKEIPPAPETEAEAHQFNETAVDDDTGLSQPVIEAPMDPIITDYTQTPPAPPQPAAPQRTVLPPPTRAVPPAPAAAPTPIRSAPPKLPPNSQPSAPGRGAPPPPPPMTKRKVG